MESFRAKDTVRWDGDRIAGINAYSNHTVIEELEPVSGLCAPAFLAMVTYDLYTAPELYELVQKGISISDEDAVSRYWCLYFAYPEAETGYVLSLAANKFSKEDILAFGQSFMY